MPPFPQRLKDLDITRPTRLLDRNRPFRTRKEWSEKRIPLNTSGKFIFRDLQFPIQKGYFLCTTFVQTL